MTDQELADFAIQLQRVLRYTASAMTSIWGTTRLPMALQDNANQDVPMLDVHYDPQPLPEPPVVCSSIMGMNKEDGYNLNLKT